MSSTTPIWGNLNVPPGGAVSKKYHHVYRWLLAGETVCELPTDPGANASELASENTSVADWGKRASEGIAAHYGTINLHPSLPF